MKSENRDFELLGEEIEGLMHELHKFHSSSAKPEMKKDLEKRFNHIGLLVKRIGGSIADDYEELEPLFWGFLQAPLKKEYFHKIIEVIEKFRNELREL